MYAVEVIDLEKWFVRRMGGKRHRVAALAGVSLSVAQGECVAVLGQNGSGKSTLVRALSTLLLPDGGSAEVFGHDVVRDGGAVRRMVNRVSGEPSSQLHERHDASDFATKTQDKLVPAS